MSINTANNDPNNNDPNNNDPNNNDPNNNPINWQFNDQPPDDPRQNRGWSMLSNAM